MIKSPPRIPELLFAAVLIWLFASGQGWSVLLADGDTGWHIRNGERIIDTWTVPHTDEFSFDTGGRPWFAWEWLSDVLFAALFRSGGLRAVSVFCGITIAASLSMLFRHMVWRSVEVTIALPLTLLVAGASSVHYLARPHAIGLLFLVVTAWLVDRDRASPGRGIWILPVVLAVWANCHGSFLAGLALVGFWFLEEAIRGWTRQSVPLAAACGAATFLNPYGWQLHAHALEYLKSDWIRGSVEEFQSPRFRSENMLQYELLLMAGLATLPWLLRRKELYAGGLILFWAHESLASVRHVPLYCALASPFIASAVQDLWSRVGRSGSRSFIATMDSIHGTWRPWSLGYTVWPLILCAVLFAGSGGRDAEPVGFPGNKFPVKLVERNLARFAARDGAPQRVFSSDQWSDYLIFRFHPAIQVYFDGRSDFFGPWRGKAYQQLMAGGADAKAILQREKLDLALIPRDWALLEIFSADPQWREVDRDQQAVFLMRNAPKIVFHPNQNSSSIR